MSKFYIFGIVFLIGITFGNLHASTGIISSLHNRIIGRPETFEEIVRKNGYLVEERFIITEDGYVLSLHRVYAGPKSPPLAKKPVVLLLHGMAASSDVWVLRSREIDLPYLLVDAGLDVWLMNCRGNTYSRRHVTLSPKNPQFWRFSWHENGISDLSATIDYITSKTGVSKITLIGHSMGATISYVLLSQRPEYNKKIDLCIGLAPVAIFTNVNRGALTTILSLWGDVKKTLIRTGIHEIFAHGQPFSQIAPRFCGKPLVKEICTTVVLSAAGIANPDRFDTSRLPFMLEHYPAGTTVDTIEHYYQNIANASFRQLDFGVAENYARYGSAIPPEYPLERITAPVVIYLAVSDQFVKPADVEALERRLPNVVATKVVQHPMFSHLDFVISKDTRELLYDDVVDVIKQQKMAKETWPYNK